MTVDGNGNVRALVKADAANPAASAITARYAYDGFGKEVAVSGVDADKNTFRFSTKQLDAETGMNYYGYRFYAANAGRWINRDPIRERGGMNLYHMCGNSCIFFHDLLGLYNNAEAAVRAAVELYNPISYKESLEYCGKVCAKCIDGKMEYSYTVTKGSTAGCTPGKAPCQHGWNAVAAWHTHGGPIDKDGDGIDDDNADNFSDADKRYARNTGQDLYLATPFGHAKVVDKDGKVTNLPDVPTHQPSPIGAPIPTIPNIAP